MDKRLYRCIVATALREDIGNGDKTTDSIFTNETATATIVTREQAVVAGLPVAAEVFFQVDPKLEFIPAITHGDRIETGTRLATISGAIASILKGERVALNFLQRLSAIATETDKAVRAVAGTKARIVDTRKTTPGLRVLEKYAVTMGGGENHRFNLSDMVLIKDNHIKGAGSITNAVTRAKQQVGFSIKIEVEACTLDQVTEALACSVDVIMLDNMSAEQMKRAVNMIAGQALVEASGGLRLKDIADIAATGVDLISLGYLTHSLQALDIALKLD